MSNQITFTTSKEYKDTLNKWSKENNQSLDEVINNLILDKLTKEDRHYNSYFKVVDLIKSGFETIYEEDNKYLMAKKDNSIYIYPMYEMRSFKFDNLLADKGLKYLRNQYCLQMLLLIII